jgi:hypothetical protein
MSEMVDRIAKAIDDAALKAWGDEGVASGWVNASGSDLEKVRHLARAAIAAMREPTSEMRIAGAHVQDQRPSEVAAVWQAMIDAESNTTAKGNEAMTRDEAIKTELEFVRRNAQACGADGGVSEATFYELAVINVDRYVTFGMIRLDESKSAAAKLWEIYTNGHSTNADDLMKEIEEAGLRIVEK